MNISLSRQLGRISSTAPQDQQSLDDELNKKPARLLTSRPRKSSVVSSEISPTSSISTLSKSDEHGSRVQRRNELNTSDSRSTIEAKGGHNAAERLPNADGAVAGSPGIRMASIDVTPYDDPIAFEDPAGSLTVLDSSSSRTLVNGAAENVHQGVGKLIVGQAVEPRVSRSESETSSGSSRSSHFINNEHIRSAPPDEVDLGSEELVTNINQHGARQEAQVNSNKFHD